MVHPRVGQMAAFEINLSVVFSFSIGHGGGRRFIISIDVVW